MTALEKGTKKALSVDEANAFFSLQRKVTAQLVRARLRPGNEAGRRFLDSLVKRGHNVLHPEKRELFVASKELVTGGFARIFRNSLKLQLVSWLVFVGLLYWVCAYAERLRIRIYVRWAHVSSEYLRDLLMSDLARARFSSGRESGTAEHCSFLALFFNNFRAAMTAFCVGVFLGFQSLSCWSMSLLGVLQRYSINRARTVFRRGCLRRFPACSYMCCGSRRFTAGACCSTSG